MAGYEDLIEVDPLSRLHHPRMPLAERAKQFQPFSVLKGYEEALEESAAVLEAKPELPEDQRLRMDSALRRAERDPDGVFRITVFETLRTDAGVRYGLSRLVRGPVRRVDRIGRTLTVLGERIPLDDIISIEGPSAESPCEETP